ncbi:MAG: DUF11 domain-containing protein [Actinomycetia bacterium]|nr:DUF11 domain-containing protein [Actinomycetes bacterium]
MPGLKIIKKNKSTRATALLVSAVLVLAGMGFPSAAQAAAGDPFDKGSSVVFVAQYGSATNNKGTQLYTATQAGDNTATLSPAGAVEPLNYNAIGFNPVDRYLYGINADSIDHLVRIGQDGVATDLGAVNGLPTTGQYMAAGAMGAGDWVNTLFVRRNSAGTNMWRVNVDTLQAQQVTLSQSVPNTADLVYYAGYLWTFWANTAPVGCYRIDPSSGATIFFPLAGKGIASDMYGAQWVYGNGTIGILGNGTGRIYQIRITDPTSASPTFAVVNTLRGPVTSNNDGASYLGEPIDLEMTKTAPATFSPGDSITYTLKVTNTDPNYSSSGYVVTDNLPAGLLNPSTTTPDVSIDNGVLTYIGGELGPQESATITITGDTDANSMNPVVNTARVVGNEEDPTPDNDQDTVISTPTITVPVSYTITYVMDNGGVETTLTVLAEGTVTSGSAAVGSQVDPIAALIAANQPEGFGPGIKVDGPFVLSEDSADNNFVVKYVNTAPTIKVARRVTYVRKGVTLTQDQILAIAGVSVDDAEEDVGLQVTGYSNVKWGVVNYPGVGYVLTLEAEDTPGLKAPIQQIAIFVEGAGLSILNKNPNLNPNYPAGTIPDGMRVGTDPDGNLIIWAPSKPISKPAAPVADKPVALKAPASSMPQTGDEFYIEFPLLVLAGALLFALLAQKRRQSGEVEHA